MSTRGQVVMLSGVFLIGGLGGAVVVRTVSSSDRSDKKVTAAEARTDSDDAEPIQLDELRDALDELGVKTNRAPEHAAVTSSETESDVGIPLTAVLGKLEHDYQVARHQEATQTPPPESSLQTQAAAQPAPAQPDQPTIIGKRPAPAPAAPADPPQRVAAVQADQIDQVNVNPGVVNVTHITDNSTTTELSVSPGYAAPAYGYYPYAQGAYVAGGYVSPGAGVYVNPGVYPDRRVYPNGAISGSPGSGSPGSGSPGYGHPVPRADARRNPFAPSTGPSSPMWPADASASLGPIFGGLP